jgi:hypothetical protein
LEIDNLLLFKEEDARNTFIESASGNGSVINQVYIEYIPNQNDDYAPDFTKFTAHANFKSPTKPKKFYSDSNVNNHNDKKVRLCDSSQQYSPDISYTFETPTKKEYR